MLLGGSRLCSVSCSHILRTSCARSTVAGTQLYDAGTRAMDLFLAERDALVTCLTNELAAVEGASGVESSTVASEGSAWSLTALRQALDASRAVHAHEVSALQHTLGSERAAAAAAAVEAAEALAAAHATREKLEVQIANHEANTAAGSKLLMPCIVVRDSFTSQGRALRIRGRPAACEDSCSSRAVRLCSDGSRRRRRTRPSASGTLSRWSVCVPSTRRSCLNGAHHRREMWELQHVACGEWRACGCTSDACTHVDSHERSAPQRPSEQPAVWCARAACCAV